MDWIATQRLKDSLRPTKYVAVLDRHGISGPLEVFTEVSVSTAAAGRQYAIDVNASTLGLSAGLPLPSVSARSRRRVVSMTGVVHATQDPEVGVRVITPSSSDLRLDAYLNAVADAFHVSANDLGSAFREANAGWLSEPVEIEVAVQTGEVPAFLGETAAIHVAAGETVRVDVGLYPRGEAGSTMFALAVTRPGRMERS